MGRHETISSVKYQHKASHPGGVTVCSDLVLREREREREKATEGRRKFHSEELYNLNSIPNVIKLSWTRWAGHVARMGELRSTHNIVVETLKERDRLIDVGWEGGNLTSKCFLQK
jgi:hypothetical protein